MSQYPQHSPPPHLQQPPQQYGMAPYGMVGAGPPQNFYAAAGRPVAEQAPVQGPAPPVYGAMAVTPLPYGWEERFDAATGKLFYLDHINQTTSWTRPQPSMDTYRSSISDVSRLPGLKHSMRMNPASRIDRRSSSVPKVWLIKASEHMCPSKRSTVSLGPTARTLSM